MDHVHLSSALFGFECPLGSSLINCFEVGLPQVHFESGPLLALPHQYHQEPLVHVFPLLSSIQYCHLTTKGSNEAFIMFQKLKCNQAPALGSKCHITLTSVCCLSVSLDQKVADSNRAIDWWPVTYSDTINLHSLEKLKYIEIQLCYTKSYCQDLKLSQHTSGSQLSYSV